MLTWHVLSEMYSALAPREQKHMVLDLPAYYVLREQGIEVWEINRPDRAKRRLQGKSDPTDAESAARTVLSGNATATPKSQTGVAEALRMLSVARRSAIKARTQTINQLRSLLISAPDDLRERLWKTKPEQCVTGCARLRQAEGQCFA